MRILGGQAQLIDPDAPYLVCGEHIRAMRRTRQISEHGLAYLLELDDAALAALEAGRLRPDDGVVTRLAHIFSFPPPALLRVRAWGDDNDPLGMLARRAELECTHALAE